MSANRLKKLSPTATHVPSTIDDDYDYANEFRNSLISIHCTKSQHTSRRELVAEPSIVIIVWCIARPSPACRRSLCWNGSREQTGQSHFTVKLITLRWRNLLLRTVAGIASSSVTSGGFERICANATLYDQQFCCCSRAVDGCERGS